jgi:carboxyl-terminal processing protease
LRPIAARAGTNAELRVVLQTLLASVGVSHFGLIPGELSPPPEARERTASDMSGDARAVGDVGASLRLAGQRIIVWRVDTGGPAWRAGIRPGMGVSRVDDVVIGKELPALARIENLSVRREAVRGTVARANTLLGGDVGDTVRLALTSHDELWDTLVVRAPVRGRMLRFGNLPPLNAVVDVRERFVDAPDGRRRIGVIAFSVWLPLIAGELDRAFDRFRDADAIVIDLRGNPGGAAGMVSGIGGHVLDSAFLIGTLTQRRQVLKLTANPRRVSPGPAFAPVRPFAGPLAILMDPLSGSTSEFFAAGLQGLGRAHIVGETSAGAALPALMDRLPNGDVMMHVVADLTDSRGRRVEGVGVIPDEPVALDAELLAAGRDPVLEAALAWAAKQPRAPAPPRSNLPRR